ncbi:Uncharacterized protein APZ42_023481 [Daphnia magna]|uniref:Uncharacterized protein n=1 Tax=Daphnia magna TaxID=35525 RepID=A0A0P6H4H4_9CRUS|nr:Uncharacterized protein APZ42_023481 [Daphnia magna]
MTITHPCILRRNLIQLWMSIIYDVLKNSSSTNRPPEIGSRLHFKPLILK